MSRPPAAAHVLAGILTFRRTRLLAAAPVVMATIPSSNSILPIWQSRRPYSPHARAGRREVSGVGWRREWGVDGNI